MFYRHKFFKIILTHLAKHDILCHKSHWFCGLVWNHPQDVVVFILNTATESGWLSPWDPPLPWGKVHEEFTAPQHTRFILPPIHPTKSSLRCVGGIFLLGSVPWKFHEPTGRDTDFPSTPLHKQGQELRSEQTATPLHEQHSFYLFLRLNNSETFVENEFWAQR